MKRTVHMLLPFMAFLLVGCGDGRPDTAEAKRKFEALYPGIRVTAVTCTEDEVVARSLEFRYRNPDSEMERSIGLQFMEIDAGHWNFMPNPPEKLP